MTREEVEQLKAPKYKRERSKSNSPKRPSPSVSALLPIPLSSSDDGDRDSVYSAYDFVTDINQDILLNASSSDDDVDLSLVAAHRTGKHREGRGAAPKQPKEGSSEGIGTSISALDGPLTFFFPLRQRELRSISRSSSGSEPVIQPPIGIARARKKQSTKKRAKVLLPKPSSRTVFAMTVVLDMDETLASARGGPIHLRPHIAEFIHACHALRCEVIVWTAGSPSYANDILAAIAKACRMDLWYHHVITRHPRWFKEEKDTAHPGVKDLRRLQRNLHDVLIIENNPASVLKQPQNAILVEDFTYPNAEDDTFEVLTSVLQDLVSITNGKPESMSFSKTEVDAVKTKKMKSKKRSKQEEGSTALLKLSVSEALQHISHITPVTIDVSSGKKVESFALVYSPPKRFGEARHYGDIEASQEVE